jgi:hypothetical protein
MVNKTKNTHGGLKSKRKYTRRKRVVNRRSYSEEVKSMLVKKFMELLNMIKLYHWKTHSYSQHKATDELHEKLSGHIDSFVEIMMGKDEKRVRMIVKEIDVYDYNNKTDFKTKIHEYRSFFFDLDRWFNSKKDNDLLNIRDEILADLNQFLYLLTLH